MRIFQIYFPVLILLGGLAANEGWAQHSIDVQRKAAQGEYYSALLTYEKMPKRKVTTQAVISAGKSAWALSLPDRAIEEFEKALRDKNLTSVERARLLLSRGIIEYQENNYQVAILFSERAVNTVGEASPLRANAWLLWGESLMKINSYGSAEQKYLKALEEAAEEDRPDASFLLAECQVKLGKTKEAKNNFEQIPFQHTRTPFSIRHLASIAIDQEKYQQAAFWLEKGRETFPDRFLDSWVDYALAKVAANQDDLKEMRFIQQEAIKKYPPSDHWLTLLNAAVEGYEWSRIKNK